jgi:energy-coupling factor transporter ATP-binding protein EcfA2
MEDGILGKLALSCKWPKTIAVTGALGSGKTEFVLNLARGLKENGKNVTIADADIINPYFCIRQITEPLEQEGFSILNPPETAKWSDMSVINPSIGNAIVGKSDHLILDVGGDAGGVMALTQFEPDIQSVGYRLLLIVNAYRPKTATPQGIAQMAARMEALCGLTVNSLVSNSHLMEDTTAEDVLRGLDMVLEAGKNMNLPVLYATVVPELYEETKSLIEKSSMGKSPQGYQVPLWPLTRFMKRPWEGSEMWS